MDSSQGYLGTVNWVEARPALGPYHIMWGNKVQRLHTGLQSSQETADGWAPTADGCGGSARNLSRERKAAVNIIVNM